MLVSLPPCTNIRVVGEQLTLRCEILRKHGAADIGWHSCAKTLDWVKAMMSRHVQGGDRPYLNIDVSCLVKTGQLQKYLTHREKTTPDNELNILDW